MSCRFREVALWAIDPEEFGLIVLGAGENVAPFEVLVIEMMRMNGSSEVAELIDDAVAPTAIDRLAAVWAVLGHEAIEGLSACRCFGDNVIMYYFTERISTLPPCDDSWCRDPYTIKKE